MGMYGKFVTELIPRNKKTLPEVQHPLSYFDHFPTANITLFSQVLPMPQNK